MLKKTTNRKTIAISVLAVLLVALLAFNVTYAYFTDSVATDAASLTFGTVIVDASSTDAVTFTKTSQAANIMPGDTIKLDGALENKGTDAAWIIFQVGNVTVSGGTVNAETARTKFVQLLNVQAMLGAENCTAVDAENGVYVLNATLAKDASLDLGATTNAVTLTIGEFGNEWQGATVGFNMNIYALQSTNVADTDAVIAAWTALDNGADWGTGVVDA